MARENMVELHFVLLHAGSQAYSGLARSRLTHRDLVTNRMMMMMLVMSKRTDRAVCCVTVVMVGWCSEETCWLPLCQVWSRGSRTCNHISS